MANLNVIVAYRGDGLDNEAREATLSDRPDDLSRLNQRINQGNGILQAWAEAKGGRVIAMMGDGGRLEVGADHLHELPQICEQYAQEVGTTASVGVGKLLSEAEKALEFSVKTGGNSIQLYTEELEQELASLMEPGNEVNLFASYLDKAEEPALNKPAAGGGMTGPSMSTPEAPEAPAGEASEHSENESLQNMLENQPPPDVGAQFSQLAEASEGQEQQQKQQQAQQQQADEETENLRGAIVDVLKQFKEQGPLWEQLKEAQPDAYKTLTGVMAAMVAMAKQLYSGEEGEEQQEEPVKKSESLSLPINQLLVNRDSLLQAYGNVGHSSGLKGSKTNGPVSVWIDEHGRNILTDGHHRLAAHLLSGKHGGVVPVQVVGRGEQNYWHVPAGTEAMPLNPTLKYGGLEDLASKDSLKLNRHGGKTLVAKSEDVFDKSTLPMSSAAPMHSTVEGFLGQLKSLPKEGPDRGKLITSHMHHAPFLQALRAHPQGKQVHTMLTGFLNSKANAGVGVGAKTVAKKDLMPGGKGDDKPDSDFDSEQLETGASTETEEHGLDEARAKEVAKDHLTEDPDYYNKAALEPGKTGRHQVVLPVGSQKDASANASRDVGKLKVADPATGLTKWRSVRAGQVMSPDGTPTSSRNPSGGKQ